MAIAYYKQLNESTAIGLWRIEEDWQTLYDRLQLNEEEEAYFQGIGHGKRNLHWLGTRVLLREMLKTDEYIACKADEHGKPFLLNFPHHISLSHSFDYAAVMISLDKPVGIDIELVKEKVLRIQSKFLSEIELATVPESDRVEHLYACWCAKEAIYKLHGKREVSFKDNIHLDPFIYNSPGSFNACLKLNAAEYNFEVQYERFGDYMIGYVI